MIEVVILDRAFRESHNEKMTFVHTELYIPAIFENLFMIAPKRSVVVSGTKFIESLTIVWIFQ